MKLTEVKEFFTCEDLSGCEALFEKAEKQKVVGTALLSDKEEVYGLGLAITEQEIYYIPVANFITGPYLCGKIADLALNTRICAIDIKTMLKHVNLEEEHQVFDAGVAAYLLNPLKSTYTCEDLAREYEGGKIIPSREELLGKASFRKAWEEDQEGLSSYACYTAETVLSCMEPLKQALEETGMWKVYTQIELPLIFTLDSMEKTGIQVKGEELKAYGDRLAVRIHELEQAIYQQAGEEFNINSPKQLGVVLFEKMEIKGGKKTKTGYSTAADVLEKLAQQQPIIKDILEYRQLAKLKSTYADGLAGMIDKDGRIHSTFNQTITATGRLSSTEPNLQNIPIRMELGREIRKVFVPQEGYVFLDADYSQIELRVLAHMSQDKHLIEAYRENADIHRTTASLVFHTPFEEVTDLQRRNAKAVNFGIIYGISGFGLSRDLNISKKEAEQYIKDYFAMYDRVKEYMDSLVEMGKTKGYVSSLFGRRRPIPELKSKNFMQRQFGERIAMNSPIQGTAADIIKIAMNHVHDRLIKEGCRSRLILQIHDELLIETHPEEIEQVKKILQEEMVHACDLAVPLIADVKQGNSWYEAK